MNPTAGSFTINSRLQRHFCVLAISFPGLFTLQLFPVFTSGKHFFKYRLLLAGAGALRAIYSSILTQHLQQGSFASTVLKSRASLVETAISLHNKVSHTFLPTAVKFHYIFNLRDISNIFQVLTPNRAGCAAKYGRV